MMMYIYLIFCLVGLITLIIELIIWGFNKRAIKCDSYFINVIMFNALVDINFINIYWRVNDEKSMDFVNGIECILLLIFTLWWYARKRSFQIYGIDRNRLEALITEQLNQFGIIHTLVEKNDVDSRIYIDGSKMYIKLLENSTLRLMKNATFISKYWVELIFYNFYNIESFKKVKESIFDKIEEVSDEKVRGISDLIVSIVVLCLLIALVVWRIMV